MESHSQSLGKAQFSDSGSYLFSCMNLNNIKAYRCVITKTRKKGCIVIGAVIKPNIFEEKYFMCNLAVVAKAWGQKIHLIIMKVTPLSALPGCSRRETSLFSAITAKPNFGNVYNK